MVGARGFELPTYGTQNRRATRLRYAPTARFLLRFIANGKPFKCRSAGSGPAGAGQGYSSAQGQTAVPWSMTSDRITLPGASPSRAASPPLISSTYAPPRRRRSRFRPSAPHLVDLRHRARRIGKDHVQRNQGVLHPELRVPGHRRQTASRQSLPCVAEHQPLRPLGLAVRHLDGKSHTAVQAQFHRAGAQSAKAGAAGQPRPTASDQLLRLIFAKRSFP